MNITGSKIHFFSKVFTRQKKQEDIPMKTTVSKIVIVLLVLTSVLTMAASPNNNRSQNNILYRQ